MSQTQASPLYVDSFFARQPIFDARGAVFGYELLYRRSGADQEADFSDQDMATLSVISQALSTPGPASQSATKTCIRFSQHPVTQGLYAALPPQTTLVEVSAARDIPQDYAEALAALKAQGYSLAVSGFTPGGCDERLLDLADVLFVDIQGLDPAGLTAAVAEAVRHKAQPGAKRVEDDRLHQLAKTCGFKLFQGFFFEKPVVVPGRKLPTGKMARLQLYRTLSKADMDLDELVGIIESDVSISYKLLTYINSAAFGLRQHVSSIRRAIMMVGWKTLKSWLWIVALSDLAGQEKTSELPYLSSIRGRFLERAATSHAVRPSEPETLFLLGLFSLLDAMLDMPMSELAPALPIDDALLDALCGRRNALSDWLAVARCFESGDWSRLDELTASLGLDPVKVANAYCEALVWAKALSEPAEAHP